MIVGRAKPPGRVPQGVAEEVFTVEVRLTDLEVEHAEALAPYLAKRAALLPEVRAFRKEKVDGTLQRDEVATYLQRELGHLPADDYLDLEWALGQVPSYLDDYDEELKDLVGGWLNRGLEASYEHYAENVRRAMEYETTAMSYEPFREFEHGLMHLIRDETGRTLEDLARWLAARYPWPVRDAAWFVLTDEPPRVEPLKMKRNSASGTYEITFAPWISEHTVRRAYRSVHEADNRPLGPKSLSAFRLVNEHTEAGQTPKWAELTRLWNRQNPEDPYKDRSALRGAYTRIEKRLSSPWSNEV